MHGSGDPSMSRGREGQTIGAYACLGFDFEGERDRAAKHFADSRVAGVCDEAPEEDLPRLQ